MKKKKLVVITVRTTEGIKQAAQRLAEQDSRSRSLNQWVELQIIEAIEREKKKKEK